MAGEKGHFECEQKKEKWEKVWWETGSVLAEVCRGCMGCGTEEWGAPA